MQIFYVLRSAEEVCLSLKDENGQYIYVYNDDSRTTKLGGRPVHYTEVFPGTDDDAISTTFGVFGYFPAMKMAIRQDMTTEELREATITDADTGADINLATQDLRALKVREFFDMDCNFENVFCKITTASSLSYDPFLAGSRFSRGALGICRIVVFEILPHYSGCLAFFCGANYWIIKHEPMFVIRGVETYSIPNWAITKFCGSITNQELTLYVGLSRFPNFRYAMSMD